MKLELPLYGDRRDRRWWLAERIQAWPAPPDGPIDLSERYLMNLGANDTASQPVTNWRTDNIYLLNYRNRAATNASYRFTKGWYKYAGNGDIVPAHELDAGAKYGTQYNWINGLSAPSINYVNLPRFERDVIFADPANDQWNIGVAPTDIAERVRLL